MNKIINDAKDYYIKGKVFFINSELNMAKTCFLLSLNNYEIYCNLTNNKLKFKKYIDKNIKYLYMIMYNNNNDNNPEFDKINNLYDNLIKNKYYYLGIQASQRINFVNNLSKFNNLLINNIADPFKPPINKLVPDTYDFEKQCILKFGEWINMDDKEIWGITNSSGSESCLYGLVYGKNYFLNLKPLLICTKKSHYVHSRFGKILDMNTLFCDVNEYDEIDINSLDTIINSNLEYIKINGVIIILTLATTIKCGYDDIKETNKIIEKYNLFDLNKCWIHIDAALGGFILPFLENNPLNYKLNKFNSVTVSAHKMFGTPYPVGIFITNIKYKLHNSSGYTSSDDGAIFCSRNGQGILYLYLYMCCKNSFQERKKEVEYCLDLKKYFIRELEKNNIEFEHNPNNGLAIYFKKGIINEDVIKKYNLVSDEKYTHIFIMISVTQKIIDQLLIDLKITSKK
jgi:histidine decarboxylase